MRGPASSKQDKIYIFEEMPTPRTVMQLSVPVDISPLVTIFYDLADTYFVGMLNDPIQNAAITLAYPVMMGFNTINDLFGIGTSRMMSRKLGVGDYEAMRKISAFGFWGAFLCAFLLASLTFLFKTPFLKRLGSDATTLSAASSYMLWTVDLGAVPAIVNLIMAYMFRSEGNAPAGEHRHHVRLYHQYHSGPLVHPSAWRVFSGKSGTGIRHFPDEQAKYGGSVHSTAAKPAVESGKLRVG